MVCWLRERGICGTWEGGHESPREDMVMGIRSRLGFLALIFLPLALCVQAEEGESPEWEQDWLELETQDDLGRSLRLQEQTRLLHAAMESARSLDEVMWERVVRLLEGWEGEANLEVAREAYLALLEAACSALTGRERAFPDEARLRLHLQKALTLSRTAHEEGSLLFYLGESWLRSATEHPRLSRRAEALLQQAGSLLLGRPPMDGVQLRLGRLYRSWGTGGAGEPADAEGSAYLTRSVQHYRALQEMEGARPAFREEAEAALEELLKPELELEIGQRFLPESDVRLEVRTRNIESVTLQVTGLPPRMESDRLTLAELRKLLNRPDPGDEALLVRNQHDLRGRYFHDWGRDVLRPGVSLPAGWYGVRIEGNGVVREDILLVTPLELAVLPRRNGDLLVWGSDGETGQPLPGAAASLLDGEGNLLTHFTTGEDGTVLVPAAEAAGWEEIHLHSELTPGHLRRVDLPQEPPLQPWILVNPNELRAGETLQWSVVGLESEEGPNPGEGPVFILPDGREMRPESENGGTGWAGGQLRIPDNLEESGSLYVRMPQGDLLHVAHIGDEREYALQVDVSGERVHRDRDVYLTSSPLGVHIVPAFGFSGDLPPYIRLRAIRPVRAGLPGKALPEAEEVVFESILSFEDADEGGLYLELPEVPAGERIVPLRIEVLSLDEPDLLGIAWIGLTAYREALQLRTTEQIVAEGESVTLSATRKWISEGTAGAIEGTFIVYRETWESRYVHRKRGTPLSEEAYLDLPDRSLLGTAKTDYRLAEQGYIREEVRREAVKATDSEDIISLQLERSGYYNIEFEPDDSGTLVQYPEGPLEVWVISETPDLRSFRSDKTRLILEMEPSGELEVLLLLERAGSAVLFDLERVDGSTLSEVQRPEEAAVYLSLDEGAKAAPLACRVMVVGERRTEVITKSPRREAAPEWKLKTEQGFYGLNPGISFEWGLKEGPGHEDGPLLWNFLPAFAESLGETRLEWQRQLHSSVNERHADQLASLSKWLPLADPFRVEGGTGVTALQTDPGIDPDSFLALYPEIRRSPGLPGRPQPFRLADRLDEPGRFSLRGTFPDTSGRWRLSLFNLTEENILQARSWLVSTELPVSSSLSGPALLREDDIAGIILSLENTTAGPVRLRLLPRAYDGLELLEPEPGPFSILPYGRVEETVRLRGAIPEEGTLEVRLESSERLSETRHEIETVGRADAYELAFHLVEPEASEQEFEFSLEGFSAARAIAASGLGTLLPHISETLVTATEEQDPRLRGLYGWALKEALARHGMEDSERSFPQSESLFEELVRSQTETGGWGWLQGAEADPWLSALIVWTLELFHPRTDPLLDDLRVGGRDYLQSVLIDGQADPRSRVVALRALAAPALHSERHRPSRIQARTFLDFMRQRSELEIDGLAMLLEVAKAFEFREEVDLIAGELRERLSPLAFQEGSTFSKHSLVYLALHDLRPGREANTALREALEALSLQGPGGGWEELAGFLYLAAAFYWQGDFHTDGMATVEVEGFEPVSLSLSPQVSETGLLEFSIPGERIPAGPLGISTDTSSALSPVIFMLVGTRGRAPQLERLEGVETRFLRQYYEETLLKGIREETVPFAFGEMPLEIGDSLHMELDFAFPAPVPVAEVIIPVPAGLVLEASNITLEETDSRPFDGAVVSQMERQVYAGGNPLEERIRLAPLPAGPFRLTVPFNVRWPGSYAWPSTRLFFPVEGAAFRLDEDRRLILEAGD